MDDDLLTILVTLERQLAEGDGDVYRRRLRSDAVVIVPGARLDREQCAAAIDAARRWDEIAFEDVAGTALDDSAALITYTFRGRRGDERYIALMTSVYVAEGDVLELVLHQQTPMP